jgi:hypothetical protein
MLLATALLVLGGVPGRPCTGDPAGTDGLVSPQERREARERVERSTILALVSAHQRSVDEDWRRQLADVIYEESIAAGVDPLMVAAIVAKESSFRSRVVSRKGAVGLMPSSTSVSAPRTTSSSSSVSKEIPVSHWRPTTVAPRESAASSAAAPSATAATPATCSGCTSG